MKLSRKAFRFPQRRLAGLNLALSDAVTAVFGLDVRSLALFRILIAAILVIDLANRLPDVAAFLTDDGILSRSLRLEMNASPDPNGFDYQWSLHLFSGHAWGQYVLMGIATFFAGWLLVGYRTGLAAVISWAMFVSIGNRNPLIYDAGDSVLRSLMFWALFIPLGRVWGLDATRSGESGKTTDSGKTAHVVVSFATAAFILQLLVVYFSAALFKMNPVWLREFSGVYYALNCDPFATRIGLTVREFPGLMKGMTAGTIFLEFAAPILLLMPWKTWQIRVAMIIGMCSMHLGMAATMTLGIFPWLCIAAWLALLPPQAWDLLLPRFQRLLASSRMVALRNRITNFATKDTLDVKSTLTEPLAFQRRYWPRRLLNATVAGLLGYAIVWNAIDGLGPEKAANVFPHRWNRLARIIGLEKNWCMFAPIPRPEDGWPILKGTLRDGSVVNLWQPEEPLPWQKPEVVSAIYVNQRWRRYLENLTMEPYMLYRPYFADWLARRWNREHSGGQADREVATVEIIRQVETTPPLGEPFPVPETVELWTKHFPPEIE